MAQIEALCTSQANAELQLCANQLGGWCWAVTLATLKQVLPYLGLVAFSMAPWAGYATPSVLITNLPAYGSFDQLSGIVLEAVPASYRIAVFIYVPGYGWVSKPTCAEPLTIIQADG